MPAMEKRACLATMKMSQVSVRYSQALSDGLSYQGTLQIVKVAFLSLHLNKDTITPIFSTQKEAHTFIHHYYPVFFGFF